MIPPSGSGIMEIMFPLLMIDGNRARRAYTHCGCVLSEQWASCQKEEKFFHGGGRETVTAAVQRKVADACRKALKQRGFDDSTNSSCETIITRRKAPGLGGAHQ